MKIIPVIDYQYGQVVLAKAGLREKYQPASSSLSQSSDIHHVIEAILTFARFKTIYIADLDCIERQHFDSQLWTSVCNKYPHIEFWIDVGSMYDQWTETMRSSTNARPIVGSESFSTVEILEAALNNLNQYNPLLSIDIKHNRILGPANLFDHHAVWPKDVIILSLGHVGRDVGPDRQVLRHMEPYQVSHNFYYGGGIRNLEDIQRLSEQNVEGALIASMLHNGKVTGAELDEIIF